jgi:hypothetical protein
MDQLLEEGREQKENDNWYESSNPVYPFPTASTRSSRYSNGGSRWTGSICVFE